MQENTQIKKKHPNHRKQKPNDNTPKIRVCSIGGLGEVGMNMYIVESNDEIIVMDCGILFADDDVHGVEYIIPDFTYLEENKHKIVAMFITHGHEDHIGALPLFLKKLDVKIYAAGIANNLIRFKMYEYPDIHYTLESYNENSIFTYKDFTVSFFRTNHSIPDSFGIAIKTKLGYIVNSGDFKFDLTPLGDRSDFYKMAKLGNEGVLCLLADSTNSKISTFSPSEKTIANSIKQMFKSIKGRIIIATFASNVYRVEQILESSVACGRKIAVFGHSMEKAIEAASKLKYINIPKSSFIPARELNKYQGDNVTIICTGSQGEPLAALSRIANGTHKQIQLRPNDTVIYSSKPIPGNEQFINRNINLLVKRGANVIKNSPLSDTHTTGHASVEEIKLMLSLIKPKYLMPVHGEFHMLKYHADVALEMGYKKDELFCLDCGDVLEFKENSKPKVIKQGIFTDQLYLDSNFSQISSETIRERKQLADEGIITAVFTINKKKKILAPTRIKAVGFVDTNHFENLTKDIKEKATEIFIKSLNDYKTLNINGIRSATTHALSQYIYDETERKPYIFTIINVI